MGRPDGLVEPSPVDLRLGRHSRDDECVAAPVVQHTPAAPSASGTQFTKTLPAPDGALVRVGQRRADCGKLVYGMVKCKPFILRELHQLLLGLGVPPYGPHPEDYNTLDIVATGDTP
jgi:hypothetical protein